MGKTYTYKKYETIADGYFQGEFARQTPFGEQKSLAMFRQVIKDYLEKKIDIRVLGLIAEELYWYLNDPWIIERDWPNKLSSGLLGCSEAHYYSSHAEEGDKNALLLLKGIINNIEQNWEPDLK